MAKRAEKENVSNKLDPEAKYKRFQEVGLSHCLAIPPGLILAEMFGVGCYVQIAVLLGIIGWVLFCIGLVGRQELADKQNQDEIKEH